MRYLQRADSGTLLMGYQLMRNDFLVKMGAGRKGREINAKPDFSMPSLGLELVQKAFMISMMRA